MVKESKTLTSVTSMKSAIKANNINERGVLTHVVMRLIALGSVAMHCPTPTGRAA